MKFRERPNILIISDLLKEGFQWSNEKSAGTSTTKEIETRIETDSKEFFPAVNLNFKSVVDPSPLWLAFKTFFHSINGILSVKRGG